MNTSENLHGQYGLVPLPVRPKEYSFEVPLRYWLFILATVTLSLAYAVQVFASTGRIWPVITISVLLLLLVYAYLDMKQRERQAFFLEQYTFPASIKSELAKRYPQLSDEQLNLVMQGLRQYFQLCNEAGRQKLSMPSRAVDMAWHEFILLTQAYARFCGNALGRFLHHIPAAGESSPKSALEGLKTTWLQACKWEGINQKSPARLPLLFEIDVALEIPDGFKHALNNEYATEMCGPGGDICCAGGCGGC